MPVITIEGAAATEGEYIVFTVRLSEPALDAVTVDFLARSGTAEIAVDATGYSIAELSGTVVFDPGETVQTFRVAADHDYLEELDESFFVELHNPTGATFGGANAVITASGWVLDNDGAGLDRAISVSSPVVTEANGAALFTISLSEAFDTDRTFTYQTFDGSAVAGSDYVARTGTVTFLAGQTEALVSVNLINDTVSEATESFGLRVLGAHGVAGATGTGRILDPDATQPVISIEGAAATESEYIVFTVRLSEPATDAVTVDFAARSGTAEVGVDATGYSIAELSGTVVFAPGETVQTFRVAADHDYDDEIDESFFVELRNPTGATFGGGNASLTATGWVLDNDGPGLNRSVAVSDAEIREGPGGRVAVFSVELSQAHDEPLTLNYQTVSGTALANSDFGARAGQITFAAGQTRIEIRVPITDDLALENTERFYLRVAPPFPSAISSRTSIATGTATIIDGTLRGTSGPDILNGTLYAERIEGFGGNDLLRGLGGNDILSGGLGNDTLEGGAGADRLIGGLGNDTYVIDAADTIVEGAGGGIDTVRAAHSLTLAAQVENLQLLGNANLNGTGNALANVLAGNNGRNVLTGGLGNDTYVIDTGDTVREFANQGFDTVRTGQSYTLGAHLEALTLIGAANLNGAGNAGHNRLTGNVGHNQLSGLDGNDTLLGGNGFDSLFGGAGLDLLQGHAGNDLLSGGLGADRLEGGAGNDNLIGGAGFDTLIGGSGADLLTGGSERDVFVFVAPADSRGVFRDRITDFAAGADDIDLRLIDAASGQFGNQSFVFGGSRAGGNSVWYTQSGGNTLVRGDVNGDARADFEIVLNGNLRLTAGDFLL